jgi:hypothetical protein
VYYEIRMKKERKELKKAIAVKEAENYVDTAKKNDEIKDAQARQNQSMRWMVMITLKKLQNWK